MSGVAAAPFIGQNGKTQRTQSPSVANAEVSTPVEITATQKMLAACSGSLVTSLLVTPLDVVRVRLQAQDHTHTPVRQTTLATGTASSINPQSLLHKQFTLAPGTHISRPIQDLGVSACCREVFWVSSQNNYCFALPTIPASPGSSTLHNTLESCAADQTAKHRFSGTWEGLMKIGRNEGVASLYRGLSPTLAMSIPANVIYFTGYEAIRYSPTSPLSQLDSNTAPLVAGSLARTISATVISPLELFRTRLQASSSPLRRTEGNPMSAFRETLEGMRSMVATDGITSLWRGIVITLWRDVPFSAIYWWGYETIRQRLIHSRHVNNEHIDYHTSPQTSHAPTETKFADAFIAGAASGALASFFTQPFDVGKTRRQVWNQTPPSGISSSASTVARTAHLRSASMVDILRTIYVNDGLRGLWTGAIPRLLKVAPACAIMISSYEVGKKYARTINSRKTDTLE